MDTHGLVVWLIIGAVAGWLAGQFMKGGGYGLVGDIVVGIVGAFIGGWLAGILGLNIGGGLIASIITATLGAILLIVILRMIKRA
ncbi:MAG TPA: GlsB/YeaQ/YmgE family stress response membrane protein [Rhizomicrobium sp.]|nr:GlsB/YeaQ/YmgE family stress response membrane protein [Rhizomicrobium sp.]